MKPFRIDELISSSDIDAFAADPHASTPSVDVGALALQIVTKLRDEVAWMQNLGGSWGHEVDALETAMAKVQSLADRSDDGANAALNRLLQVLHGAGEPGFVNDIRAWIASVEPS